MKQKKTMGHKARREWYAARRLERLDRRLQTGQLVKLRLDPKSWRYIFGSSA